MTEGSIFLRHFLRCLKILGTVQMVWFKNRRSLLQETKIVDRNQIFVGSELILCGINRGTSGSIEFLLIPLKHHNKPLLFKHVFKLHLCIENKKDALC
jgi:hypothetical protein